MPNARPTPRTNQRQASLRIRATNYVMNYLRSGTSCLLRVARKPPPQRLLQ
jgi:hypothetical protein